MTSVNMDLELNEAIQEPMPEEPPKSIEFQSKKLTWPELRAVVSELRRQLSSLSTMVPTDFTFRTLQDGRTRIYFLSSPYHG